MAPDINSLSWVIAWACLAAFVLLRHARRGPNVGLLLTYLFIFGTLHWFAPVLHLLPWFTEFPGDLTAEGLRESTFALAGFVAGVELLTIARRRMAAGEEPDEELDLGPTTRLVNIYLVAGVVLYAFTLFGGRLQFLAAVVSTGSTLVAVSVGLKCWLEQKSGRIGQSWLWLAVAGLFPLLTLIAQGFLGYGFVAVLIVASFVASQQSSRWKTALAGVFLIYFGLSIYVTYMRDRTDIRDVVWGGQAFDARFDQLASTFRSVEWFDPWDHRSSVPRRSPVESGPLDRVGRCVSAGAECRLRERQHLGRRRRRAGPASAVARQTNRRWQRRPRHQLHRYPLRVRHERWRRPGDGAAHQLRHAGRRHRLRRARPAGRA